MKPFKLFLLFVVLFTTAFILYASYQNANVPIEETGPRIEVRDHAIV